MSSFSKCEADNNADAYFRATSSEILTSVETIATQITTVVSGSTTTYASQTLVTHLSTSVTTITSSINTDDYLSSPSSENTNHDLSPTVGNPGVTLVSITHSTSKPYLFFSLPYLVCASLTHNITPGNPNPLPTLPLILLL